MTTGAGPGRVILTAGCLADAEAMLALAAGLASETGAALMGVLVEDSDALALAGMTAARMVDPGGRTLAGLDPDRMAAAYARDALRFDRMGAEAAARAALRWTFRRAEGRLAEALAALVRPGDLLVLSAGPLRLPPREIVLQADADPALAPLAAALAARLNRPLRPLAAGGPEALGPGSVLFAGLDIAHLAAHLRTTRCIHVLRA